MLKPTISKNGRFKTTREQYNFEIARMEAEIENDDRADHQTFGEIHDAIQLLNHNINNMYMTLLHAGIMRRQ